ncbi:hypothetical protein Tph_c14650 [Thermacetogenium phaeum DSM 12270]|uniref:Uncharacterized protein n=1 Tax=Thermacetogenium phaeum (strain ATCC BAA-254 / DSM 26808 / PB) TaxID=1089553 RepID=K4LUH5_THEPS|nr:hypothetical protein Tph_c14650 [Thermacetogenium phaeum DSM 12270]
MVALSPLAGAVSAVLAWGFMLLPQAGEDLTLVFLVAGGVSFCLFLGLALVFKNCLLRSAGAEIMSVISECSASKISANEAKEILTKMEVVLKGCKQAQQAEKERLERAVTKISGFLKEADAVVGLVKEKVEKMAEIAASVAGSNENSENASKEDS